MSIHDDLFAMQEVGYRQFQCKLLPTVAAAAVIGVRMPRLRAYAKGMQRDAAEVFRRDLPHRYYEENNLHAILINEIGDFSQCMAALEQFLPYVDNWATCDSLRPRCIKKNKEAFLPYIRRWLACKHTYTVRFAIEMLMVHYLEEAFEDGYPSMVASVYSEEYYVNMMIAWYFATALAKQYEAVIGYLEQARLPEWVHHKTIQKAVESDRVSKERKQYLQTLRKKG